MHFVSLEMKLIDIFFGSLNARVILIRIQDSLDLKSGTGASTANKVHHGLVVNQRLALPVQAGDEKGKDASGSSARPKVPMRRSGADCLVVPMRRSNVRGGKGWVTRGGIWSTGNRRNRLISTEGGSF